MLITPQCYLVLLDVLVTLTFSSNHQSKVNKYSSLKDDIEQYGWKCELIYMEVGSRGYISPDNRRDIWTTTKL